MCKNYKIYEGNFLVNYGTPIIITTIIQSTDNIKNSEFFLFFTNGDKHVEGERISCNKRDLQGLPEEESPFSDEFLLLSSLTSAKARLQKIATEIYEDESKIINYNYDLKETNFKRIALSYYNNQYIDDQLKHIFSSTRCKELTKKIEQLYRMPKFPEPETLNPILLQ